GVETEFARCRFASTSPGTVAPSRRPRGVPRHRPWGLGRVFRRRRGRDDPGVAPLAGGRTRQQGSQGGSGDLPALPRSRLGSRRQATPRTGQVLKPRHPEVTAFMTLSDLSIRNPVFAVMLSAAMIVFGYLGYRDMGVSQFPEIDFPVVSITITREA